MGAAALHLAPERATAGLELERATDLAGADRGPRATAGEPQRGAAAVAPVAPRAHDLLPLADTHGKCGAGCRAQWLAVRRAVRAVVRGARRGAGAGARGRVAARLGGLRTHQRRRLSERWGAAPMAYNRAPPSQGSRMSNPAHGSVLEMIGNTPLMAVRRVDTGPCQLFLKLENQTPGGSIKDRVGLYLIQAAERAGALEPGGTLIEATAGNTGLGLALVAAQKGYRLLLVIPDKMSQEKIFHLKAMGADVVMTRSDVSKGHPEYYRDVAERLAREIPGSHFVNQFGNPANAQAHEETTAPEIWEQMGHELHAVVCGAGTGGTLAGLTHFFARVAPQVRLVLADPAGSGLASFATTGALPVKMTPWLVEGIGDLRDLIARRHSEHAAVTVNSTETVMAAYRRMKLYDVSQVPVMHDGRIVGIVDEEDILLEVVANPEHFNEPVTQAMASHLVTVPVDAPVSQLMEIFKRGMVAIVMHHHEFQGLITRIDLLNWLRRRL